MTENSKQTVWNEKLLRKIYQINPTQIQKMATSMTGDGFGEHQMIALRIFSGKVGEATPMKKLRKEHRKIRRAAVMEAMIAATARFGRELTFEEELHVKRLIEEQLPSLKQWARDNDKIEIIEMAHLEANKDPTMNPGDNSRRKNKKPWSDGAKWRSKANRKKSSGNKK